MASSGYISYFGLTEPNHSSDSGSTVTQVKKVNSDYYLSGNKVRVTNSPIVDISVVWAKDDERRIHSFVLEKSWEGLSAPTIYDGAGLRTSIIGEVVMGSMFVPGESTFPKVHGLRSPFTHLNSARYGISWGALSAIEFCWYTAHQYMPDRQ